MTWADEVARLVEAPTWIMDGNYGGTLPARLTAADTVIYLDFPTWICLAAGAAQDAAMGWSYKGGRHGAGLSGTL